MERRGSRSAPASSLSGFQHRLRHFLHEQGNAVCALNNVLPDGRREELVAGDAVDHGLDVALRQPVEW